MLLPVRAEVRILWLRLLASSVLIAAFVTVSCSEQDLGRRATLDASAGAPASEAGTSTDAGGSGGQAGEPGAAEGGTSGVSSSPDPDAGASVGEPDVDAGGSAGADSGLEPEPEPDAVQLPCDVAAVLRARCQACHSREPVPGTTVSLLTYDDLTARSQVLPSLTIAARSVQRMLDSVTPMPPAPVSHATPAEIATLKSWVAAGTPRSKCDPTTEPGTPTNPYDAAPTCSSATYWGSKDQGSRWMMPGVPCIACHRQYPNRPPQFTVAGSVFPTAHEPDLCFGVPAATGATIVITDANGKELSPIAVATGGNFGAIFPGLALPYRAKVVVGNTERVMLTPQMNGDCNTCHTQAGTQGARGRVIVP